MKTGELTRLTFDIPEETHIKLKTFAALHKKSMRAVLIELIEKDLQKRAGLTILNLNKEV